MASFCGCCGYSVSESESESAKSTPQAVACVSSCTRHRSVLSHSCADPGAGIDDHIMQYFGPCRSSLLVSGRAELRKASLHLYFSCVHTSNNLEYMRKEDCAGSLSHVQVTQTQPRPDYAQSAVHARQHQRQELESRGTATGTTTTARVLNERGSIRVQLAISDVPRRCCRRIGCARKRREEDRMEDGDEDLEKGKHAHVGILEEPQDESCGRRRGPVFNCFPDQRQKVQHSPSRVWSSYRWPMPKTRVFSWRRGGMVSSIDPLVHCSRYRWKNESGPHSRIEQLDRCF